MPHRDTLLNLLRREVWQTLTRRQARVHCRVDSKFERRSPRALLFAEDDRHFSRARTPRLVSTSGPIVYPGRVMRLGCTRRSNSAPERKPSSIAASRSVVPRACAVFATLAALS